MSTWSDKMKDTWWTVRRDRRVRVVALVALSLFIILAVLYGVFTFYGTTDRSADTGDRNTNTNNLGNSVNVPATGQRRIDGVDVAWADANTLPIAVMIENLVQIRPQFGLSQANLVYEALAEGGITRFMAVFANHDAIVKIGPVRSARHYFVDWAEEYGGVYAYVGGSPQALGVTNSSDYITDLNQFYNAAYYYRAEDVDAPHNLFTSSELLSYALRDKSLTDVPGEYASYEFKTNADKSNRPTDVTPITIDFSTADYAVEWRYNRDDNSYWRWNGGTEHRDANTDAQLQARNVVVQKVVTTVLEADTGRLDMETIGEGDAIIFQDGISIEGRWKKTERGGRTEFFTTNSERVAFNPGTTWIEVVSTDTAVTY